MNERHASRPSEEPMSGRAPFMPLTSADVSYESLLAFERRMIEATKAGRVSWEQFGLDYHYNGTAACVYVSERGVQIYDDHGVRVREFSYETDALYDAIETYYRAMADATIDLILADLEAMEAAV